MHTAHILPYTVQTVHISTLMHAGPLQRSRQLNLNLVAPSLSAFWYKSPPGMIILEKPNGVSQLYYDPANLTGSMNAWLDHLGSQWGVDFVYCGLTPLYINGNIKVSQDKDRI